ncbi:ParB/RepB/Spo0J family partition protein [Patescibacteria group bacterium]|nr:ParB/RepB/Spo0J family partition protein [Patescibacteria group bacterium]MBU1891098.1 ParB/RepB/Spo0J family partition protein [Patescibacteria group bacterium]
MSKYQGLGRGLNALIPPNTDSESPTRGKKRKEIVDLPINSIYANPRQPRSKMDRKELEDLVNSIKEHGVIQPILVAQAKNGYQLIAGQRRHQAAKILNLNEIPAIVRPANDQEQLELAIIENVQREDLNPIDRANAYQQLIDDFSFSQEQVAKKIGQSRSQVTNTLRLLHLPNEVKRAIIENKISEGHAKVLLSLPSQTEVLRHFNRVLANNLTVRETEKQVRKVSVKAHRRKISTDPNITSLEDGLSKELGTKVKISKRGKKGNITIEFYSEEELYSIVKKLNK